MRIAVVSDLHIGSGARGLDLCPHFLEDSKKIGREPDYLATFEALAASLDIAANPISMLCVTGDISNGAHVEEFKCADMAIQRIAKSLSVPNEKIYFVPGNHDVHWGVMKLEPTSFWTRHRYAPLLQDDLNFSKSIGSAITGSFDQDPYFVIWETEEALIVGINSAAYDGPEEETHHGLIRQESLGALADFLKTKPIKSTQLRMCMLHHHPVQYSEATPDSADFSIAVNAENLVLLLNENRFDLIIHGHKHHPRLKSNFSNNSHPYVTLCAGSFSAVLHPLHYGSISNSFHIIDVEGRDQSTQGILGEVNSWTFSPGDKWGPSHQIKGMHATEVFGSSATISEIERRVKMAVVEVVAAKGAARWDDIVKIDKGLCHVRTDSAFSALCSAATELGHDMLGDPQTSNKHWAVFPRSQV
jgi:3',5'-cyclic AMP phosphodiesterase CpdA